MSYILDALKKADAERERGTVPGIHAQLAGAWHAPVAQRAPFGRRLLLIFGAVLVVVVVSGSIAWRIWSKPPTQSVAVKIAAPEFPVLLPALSPNQLPSVPTTLVPQKPTAVTARAVEVESTPPPRTISPPNDPVAAPRKPTSTASVAVVVPKQAEARAVAAAASATVDNKVSPLAEMPDGIRRELPPLTISGAIYSENVANRFLIINGQIFHETETPAPGVVLHKIKLKSAVLSFKGFRYSVTY